MGAGEGCEDFSENLKNFRTLQRKIFGTKSKIRQFCPTKFFHRFLISHKNFPIKIHKKNMFNMRFVLIWSFLDFSGQNNSAAKIFGELKNQKDKKNSLKKILRKKS